jgi:hypothetical protein
LLLIDFYISCYAAQTNKIKEALKICFQEHADQIVLRAKDNTWGNMGDEKFDGKQKYLSSAAEEFIHKSSHPLSITRCSSLLIDDQGENIRIALRNSVQAILFLPEKPEELFNSIFALGEKPPLGYK